MACRTSHHLLALGALALAACGAPSGRPEAGKIAAPVLSDARTDGGAGFYFLPPVAPQPDPAPANAAGLAPEVVVEALGEGTATVLATFPAGSVAAEGDHYQVLWRAGDAPLVRGITYRIRVTLDGIALGHADAELADDGAALRFLYADELFPLTGERTVPVKFAIGAPVPTPEPDPVVTPEPDPVVTPEPDPVPTGCDEGTCGGCSGTCSGAGTCPGGAGCTSTGSCSGCGGCDGCDGCAGGGMTGGMWGGGAGW